ncbi:MAG TPA: DNA methyltransferase [Candidatus Sulfotelmatobacter sp.]|nr:DNA methyltransferase [Candidatus Sulfotelmatobacter sp.]
MKPYIQPFERTLALQELEVLARATPQPTMAIDEEPECFQVRSNKPGQALARELAFWEAVCDGRTIHTTQSLRESTVNVVRNGIPLDDLMAQLPFKNEISLPNRRCLRYGTHGLHEYRGKFFPQLVRSFINIAKIPIGGLVADPFCGSGTTGVEAILANRRTIGMDLNPLSVFMARTKCQLLGVKYSDMEEAYLQVRTQLLAPRNKTRGDYWVSKLSQVDQDYLKIWFDAAILDELDLIATCISERTKGAIHDFMLLCLSNVLRQVSWQKVDDLRVRRELKAVDEIDPIKEFLEELGRSVRLVLAFLRQEGRVASVNAEISEGDSRQISKRWEKWAGKIDAAITSPPYATALPYLDTDRLSLCFLGLLPRDKHRALDHEMIGNREIADAVRKRYWQEFSAKNHDLPSSVCDLISKIQRLNLKANVGFRRRNLPSLLFKYFYDMKKVFAELDAVLKPGASAFFVVGNNHTIAGGQRVDIETVELLQDVAKSVGLEIVETIAMDMLISRDIFRKNAIDSESILHFRRRS